MIALDTGILAVWNRLLYKWLLVFAWHISRKLWAYFCYSQGWGQGEVEGKEDSKEPYLPPKRSDWLSSDCAASVWHLELSATSWARSQDRTALRTVTWGPESLRVGVAKSPPCLQRGHRRTPREEWCPQLHDQGDKEIWGKERGIQKRRTEQRKDVVWIYNSVSQALQRKHGDWPAIDQGRVELIDPPDIWGCWGWGAWAVALESSCPSGIFSSQGP